MDINLVSSAVAGNTGHSTSVDENKRTGTMTGLSVLNVPGEKNLPAETVPQNGKTKLDWSIAGLGGLLFFMNQITPVISGGTDSANLTSSSNVTEAMKTEKEDGDLDVGLLLGMIALGGMAVSLLLLCICASLPDRRDREEARQAELEAARAQQKKADLEPASDDQKTASPSEVKKLIELEGVAKVTDSTKLEIAIGDQKTASPFEMKKLIEVTGAAKETDSTALEITSIPDESKV